MLLKDTCASRADARSYSAGVISSDISCFVGHNWKQRTFAFRLGVIQQHARIINKSFFLIGEELLLKESVSALSGNLSGLL